MSIVLPNPIAAGAAANAPFLIPEDSIVLKVLACVPAIGNFVSVVSYFSLKTKLLQPTTIPHTIELIRVKNDFIVADIMRNMFFVVLLVSQIALGVFSGGWLVVPVLGAIFFTIIALVHLIQINQNNKIIRELQATGYRAGMAVA